jgi:hypothetical protein
VIFSCGVAQPHLKIRLEKKKNGRGDRVVGLCLDVTVTPTSKNTTKSASATGVTLTTSTVLTALVTDLSGDVLWANDPATPVPTGSLVEPIKLLPNGHFLITFTVSTAGLASSSVLRPVDLPGTFSGFSGNSYLANDVDGSEQQLFIS